MELLAIICVFLIVLFLYFLIILLLHSKSLKKPPKTTKIIKKTPATKVKSEYDREGYNSKGYNAIGKNRQGKYNRYYNVKCYKTDSYSEEGFLNIRKYPLYLTNHASERMRERMGIVEYDEMKRIAFEAYQFGKSKLQIMKSERAFIEEKEQEYENSIILIYRGFCYVFTEDNGLKTVYKNDKIIA